MGNHISGNTGSNHKAKIMKMNGEFFKQKTPVQVEDIIKDYPGHVLFDSDEFTRFKLRAKPLVPETLLQPKKIYLLVQPTRFPTTRRSLQRIQSDVTGIAQDRLQSLIPRRSLSDLPTRRNDKDGVPSPRRTSSLPGSPRSIIDDGGTATSGGGRPVRFKVTLPKAQVERIMEQSKDKTEMAEKIIQLYKSYKSNVTASGGGTGSGGGDEGFMGHHTAPAVLSTVTLPTVQEESSDDKDKEVGNKHCIDFQSMCSPLTTSRCKYKRLTNG